MTDNGFGSTDGAPKVDIRALAALARLKVSDEEVVRLEGEIPGILAFVHSIANVASAEESRSPEHRNVMREDTDAFEPGKFTEALLSAAPGRSKNRVTVKQVLKRK